MNNISDKTSLEDGYFLYLRNYTVGNNVLCTCTEQYLNEVIERHFTFYSLDDL